MSKNFRTLRPVMGPAWLTSGEGGLVGYALDILKDAVLEHAYGALLTRFPEAAPEDAIPKIGRDRRVIRGLVETPDAYVARLLRWLDDRKQAGSPFALLQKLAEYTGPVPMWRTVDARGNWFTRQPDGTESFLLNQGNWNWDGIDPARWSRFWVIVYPNGLWARWPNDWGDAAGPDWSEQTGSLGTTTPAEVVSTIRAIVADWKPDGTRCVNVIEALDPASFSPSSPEPDGNWGHWSKLVGGVRVPSRLATARYWDGV